MVLRFCRPRHPIAAACALLFCALLSRGDSLTGWAREWDRAGAVRSFEQAAKSNAALHAEPAAARTPQKYLEVIQKYRDVPLKDPHFNGSDDSLYLIAKLYQEMGERFGQVRYYQLASEGYQYVVAQYPGTPFGPDALMAAGEILLHQLGNADLAAEQFRRVTASYAASAQSKSAQQQLALLEKKKKDAKAAETSTPATDRGTAPAEKPAIVPPRAGVSPGTAFAATKALDIPRPAQPTSTGVQTLTRTLGLKTRRIVIDPGHGGHDTGTVGKNGLKEKDLALDLALRLRGLLEERLGAQVILTRETDVFIPLEERTQVANRHKADLFVSIHCNSSTSTRVSGVETFVLNMARTFYEKELAARENAASHKTISDLEDLVRTITRQDKLDESRELARCIQKRLQQEMTKQNPTATNRGVKQAPFVVLAGASVPSVLTEVAFLSNARDAAALTKDKPRSAAAEALCQGISDYVRSLSVEATATSRPTK